MFKTSLFIVLLTGAFAAHGRVDTSEQPTFTIDENVWVAFYDVPSRRFRAIRDKFLRRDFAAAARDLDTSIAFLRVEVERADPVVQDPLAAVLQRLQLLRATIDDPAVTISDFDAAFARAHWLLSQHYLVLAVRARNSGQHRNAGHYLWATAHHLERTILWSNARIDKDVLRALESTRNMSVRLRESKRPETVYRDKPLVAAARTLARVGKDLDRKVWVDEIKPRQ